MSKELKPFKVAFEREIINVAVKVQQVEELDLHLVEKLSSDSPEFSIVCVLEIKIVEVFCSHENPCDHQPVHVTTCHVKLLVVLLDSVD